MSFGEHMYSFLLGIYLEVGRHGFVLVGTSQVPQSGCIKGVLTLV